MNHRAWRDELVARVKRERGGQLSALEELLLEQLATTAVVLRTLSDSLLTHGTLTAKGHARAVVSLYADLGDRLHRLARTLGLEATKSPGGPSSSDFSDLIPTPKEQ